MGLFMQIEFHIHKIFQNQFIIFDFSWKFHFKSFDLLVWKKIT